MIDNLLILGFTLSLDNFRTAIALGGLRLTWRHALQVALVFGVWDTLAPPLSLDNAFAGTSLGLLGFSPWVTASLFGAMTVLMTFLGLGLGRVAAHFIRLRSDLLTGVALVIMAFVLGLGLD